ncbi:MAG: hypothetical protein ACI81L_001865 [Verrucomicrobiales bacterium]|jgi:hypothetical protein
MFSVLLSAVLITMNTQSSADSVETAAIRVLDDGAGRVNARQVGNQLASRQVVSPSLATRPESFALVDSEVAGLVETFTDPGSEAAASADPNNVGPNGDRTELASPAPSTTIVTQRSTPAPATTRSPLSATTTTRAPATTTRAPATTTRAPATTTTTRAPVVNGRYTVAQVIDGTIGAGDGSNPNEEAPMGRHDAPLYLPQSWNWAQGPTRNSAWGNLGSGQFAEFRCAVIPENGHNPPVGFRINVRNGAYYQFVNGTWNKAFDVSLTSTANGGYLGNAGRLNSNPFSGGGHGRIEWRREADGSYSAPWNSSALMMHFWAGERQRPASGQTAEFLSSELRLQQPDGQQVDLSRVRVLFQCGIDYYNTTGGQGTKVPGPGIAKYHRMSSAWKPGLWVTLPGNTSANSAADFRTWLQAHLPPNVKR